MFTETKVIDQITILEDGTILYREANKIFRDSVKIAESYHRASLVPGADASKAPARVVSICNVIWNPTVIADYKEKQRASG